MSQQAFTIVTEVGKESLQDLKTFLQKIGDGIKKNTSSTVVDFSAYDKLHYCCFIIIDEDSDQGNSVPLLVFEGNIDGDVKKFLSAMIDKDLDFITRVYNFCTGHPQSDDKKAWSAYLKENDKGFNAYYRGHPGRTVNEIRFEQDLRQSIETYLDDNYASLSQKKPEEVRKAVQQFVLANDQLKRAQKVPEVSWEIRYGQNVFYALLLAVLGPIVLGVFGMFGGLLQFLLISTVLLFLVWLRYAESHDISIKGGLRKDRYEQVVQAEDIRLQNHLSSVVYVKPGKMRLLTIKVVLFAIRYVARLVATEGNLAGIVTIHFARWVIVDAGSGSHYVIFFSNYDGSWENYLGEFIDLASNGLTAVWSNTQLGKDEGFPDTKWLFLIGGSRHEQLFKTFARNSQYTELIWYAAYPDLSVKNVNNNIKIRNHLFDDATDPAEWLRRF
jgi:hypothetical protein